MDAWEKINMIYALIVVERSLNGLRVVRVRMKHMLNLYFASKALKYRFEPASVRYRLYSWLVRKTD